jgi:hypothetical protein
MKNRFLIIFCIIATLSLNLFAQDAKPVKKLSQPILMALPSGTKDKDPVTLYNEDKNVESVCTAINKVLADRNLVARDIKLSLSNIDKLRAKIPTFSSDPNAYIAANAGADVYLEFSIELIKEGPATKVRINFNVKEAATALLLGANSGTSKAMVTNDISSLSAIAINNCIEDVMQQVRSYWAKMPTEGKPILLTISSQNIELNQPTPNGKRIDRDLQKLLKDNTISCTRGLTTAKNMMFNPVYVDIYKYDDIAEFGYLIEDLFSTFGVKFNTEIEGKSIEITVTQ